jgi:uncharacterized protein CbrC (UPF0167 family)
MKTNYICAICKKKFNVFKFWTKIKYQDMAKTLIIDGQEQTYYWREIFCLSCAKKHNL